MSRDVVATNPTGHPFRRPVSRTERLYLAGADLAPPLAIQLVVEGAGRLDAAELARAVAAAGQACPGSRLVRRGRFWVDGGEPPPVRALAGTTLDRHRFDAAAMRSPLTPEAGPTCEVLLLDASPDAPACVVFRAFHGVMDGRGALLWMYEVFRALRGEPAVGALSTLTDDALLARLGTAGRRRPPAFDAPSAVGAGAGRADTRGFVWRRRSLDGTHPALVAKVAAVVGAAAGRGARIMVPVDLRRHADHAGVGSAATANLSLPVFLDTAGESWEELHERLLTALAEGRELATSRIERLAGRIPPAVLHRGLAAADALSRRTGRYPASAIVSHLGRIDPAAVSAPGFEASTVYSLPAHAAFMPVQIVGAELPGRTELTISCHGGPEAGERAEELLERVAEAVAPAGMRTWPGNRTDEPFPDDTVTALFARQVAATPDAVALTGPDGELTYAELDRRAAAVATALRARGVGPGTVVGLLADRSVAALAGLWGVLRAGAAYLPLDPRHPDSRLRYVLGDAGAPVCLVQRRHDQRVRIDGCATLVLEDVLAHDAQPEAPETADARPDDLVYVIYTSGSTGRPKGVQVTHRNVVAYLAWARRRYRVDAGTRFALFTSLAFDLTGTAIFLPLSAGGSIALVPGEFDHLTLRDMLERSGANALKLTPAHLDLIGRLDVAPAGFRVLVVGGEQLRGAVAARAQQLFGPGCRIVNEYGPTEATIGCIVHVFDAERDGAAPAVPIGVPVANTRVYLLDADRRFVEAGEIGEMYLAGAQLARGYLGRQDLDRERFVRLADGTRVYRTGDLARLREDGVLEYLGRTDDQIKIRGHRIEPGEVEAVLEEHPAVRRAFVTAQPGPTGPALCAYVVIDGREAPVADELTAHAAHRLPAALVPAAVVPVADLPRTVNGKVDVRALPDPFATARTAVPLPHEPLPARDGIEEAVAKIWAEILDVDLTALDPDTDFHRLGGDSLALVEMIAAVASRVVGAAAEARFMAGVHPVIRNPTLASVAAAVRRACDAPEGKGIRR